MIAMSTPEVKKTPDPAPDIDGGAGQPGIAGIIDRLKRASGARSDAEIAQLLGAERQNVTNWRRRGTIPYDKITAFALDTGVSLDWLLFERGPQKIDQLVISEPGSVYRVHTTADVVYQIAGDVYMALQPEGIAINPGTFSEIVKTLHRDMLDRGEDAVPAERVAAFIRLALIESQQ